MHLHVYAVGPLAWLNDVLLNDKINSKYSLNISFRMPSSLACASAVYHCDGAVCC